jgi:hypothetical protein
MDNPFLFNNCPECGRPGFVHYEEDNCYKCDNKECGCTISEEDYALMRIS